MELRVYKSHTQSLAFHHMRVQHENCEPETASPDTESAGALIWDSPSSRIGGRRKNKNNNNNKKKNR